MHGYANCAVLFVCVCVCVPHDDTTIRRRASSVGAGVKSKTYDTIQDSKTILYCGSVTEMRSMASISNVYMPNQVAKHIHTHQSNNGIFVKCRSQVQHTHTHTEPSVHH